jgi:hypothetical protein
MTLAASESIIVQLSTIALRGLSTVLRIVNRLVSKVLINAASDDPLEIGICEAESTNVILDAFDCSVVRPSP